MKEMVKIKVMRSEQVWKERAGDDLLMTWIIADNGGIAIPGKFYQGVPDEKNVKKLAGLLLKRLTNIRNCRYTIEYEPEGQITLLNDI